MLPFAARRRTVGLYVQGSVVYCKKLPSEEYIVGIRLGAPVEHWIEALGLGSPDAP